VVTCGARSLGLLDDSVAGARPSRGLAAILGTGTHRKMGGSPDAR
jgi:hypothetical protein